MPSQKDLSSAHTRCTNTIQASEIQPFVLEDDGTYPNNEKLPLLVYQAALKLPIHEPAATIETLFEANRWDGSWRNGIYGFHHYHSTAHEVLGVYGGSARVRFGGESGISLEVTRGDVVIIPAGVAHKNLGSNPDFRVVGAYPIGQNWDMCYGDPKERPRADRNIDRVALPESDPVFGVGGPMKDYWLNQGVSLP